MRKTYTYRFFLLLSLPFVMTIQGCASISLMQHARTVEMGKTQAVSGLTEQRWTHSDFNVLKKETSSRVNQAFGLDNGLRYGLSKQVDAGFRIALLPFFLEARIDAKYKFFDAQHYATALIVEASRVAIGMTDVAPSSLLNSAGFGWINSLYLSEHFTFCLSPRILYTTLSSKVYEDGTSRSFVGASTALFINFTKQFGIFLEGSFFQATDSNKHRLAAYSLGFVAL